MRGHASVVSVGKPACGVQHSLRQVGGGHLCAKQREVHAGLAQSASHIEQLLPTQVAQATAEREALENTIRTEVTAAVRRYQSALRFLELIRTGVVNETEAGLSITQLAYKLGDAKLTDVIFQQRSLIDAQIAQFGAEAEVAAAQADLDLALGVLK